MEEKTIAPIQTYYNGYHFRSRLEARWAVFFDKANIKYEYEPEGFETDTDHLYLSKNEKYLPDFYLPEYEFYVEVKPYRSGATDELYKAISIMGYLRKTLLLLRDVPNTEECGIWWFPIYFYHPVEREIKGYKITFLQQEDDRILLRSDVGPGSAYEHIHCVKEYKNGEHLAYLYKQMSNMDKDIKIRYYDKDTMDDYEAFFRYSFDGEYLRNCYRAARQARFEYGETP